MEKGGIVEEEEEEEEEKRGTVEEEEEEKGGIVEEEEEEEKGWIVEFGGKMGGESCAIWFSSNAMAGFVRTGDSILVSGTEKKRK